MNAATLIRDIESARIDPQELKRFLLNPRPLEMFRKDANGARTSHDDAVIAELSFAKNVLGNDFAKNVAQFLKDEGCQLPISGGSFLSGSNTELFYVSIVAGTQLNTFTTEASLFGGLPPVIIPAGFFQSAADIGKSLKLHVIGRLGTTGTPTFTFTARLRTNTTWAADGVAMSSAAITAGSGVTLAPWTLDLDIVCRALVGGATGLTLGVIGDVRAGLAFAAGGGVYTIPTSNTAFTVTVDNSVTQYLYLSAACGTSNGSNLIQAEMVKVFGEN